MDKLVGEYLRDMTTLSSSQVVTTLRNQLVLRDEGERKLFGELLLEAGWVTREQLEEALREQRAARSSPLQLPSYSQPYDVPIL